MAHVPQRTVCITESSRSFTTIVRDVSETYLFISISINRVSLGPRPTGNFSCLPDHSHAIAREVFKYLIVIAPCCDHETDFSLLLKQEQIPKLSPGFSLQSSSSRFYPYTLIPGVP